MIKYQIQNNDDLLDIIIQCYASDDKYLSTYHELAGQSVLDCSNRTYGDFINNDVQCYVLINDNNVIGYFGDLVYNNESWLTGFFIKPEFRTKDLKKSFWDIVVNHFNGKFKVGMILKNPPGIKFLLANGCKYSHDEMSPDGPGQIFTFMKESV